MPAQGWKSVSVPEETARMVDAIAGWTERSSAFVVNKILETAAKEILVDTPGTRRHPLPPGVSFDDEAAGRFGIHGRPSLG